MTKNSGKPYNHLGNLNNVHDSGRPDFSSKACKTITLLGQFRPAAVGRAFAIDLRFARLALNPSQAEPRRDVRVPAPEPSCYHEM